MNALRVMIRLMVMTGGAMIAGFPALVRAADAPAADAATAVPTVPAAVATLVVLAEQCTQLQNLRVRLQSNVDHALTDVAACDAARPGAADGDAALAAWQARHDELAKRVEIARASTARFDEKTFPAFVDRVDEAKKGVSRAWAAGKPSAADNKRVTDASATLSAAFQAIEKLQKPAAAAKATSGSAT